MPAAVMDLEAPSSSDKQVAANPLEEIQNSDPSLLFEESSENSTTDVFADLPDLEQDGDSSKIEISPDLRLPASSGLLQRAAAAAGGTEHDKKGTSPLKGSCGLYNLGNTCFMNAGLQCLFCNVHLVKFFHEDFELNDTTKDTLAGKFCQLLRMVWSGKFSLIHPLEFKNTLGMYYPQFQNFRQHDCQEFVALLLDGLHEQLNQGHHSIKTKSKTVEVSNKDAARTAVTDMAASHGTTVPSPNNCSQISGSQSDPNHCVSEAPTHRAFARQADRQLTDILKLKNSKLTNSHQAFLTGQFGQQTGTVGRKPFHYTPNQLYVGSGNNSEHNVTEEGDVSFGDQTRKMYLPALNKLDNALPSADPPFSRDVCAGNSEENNMVKTISKAPSCEEDGAVNNINVCVTRDQQMRFLPKLEDFYAKEMKTLNTNVLATEYMQVEIQTDSEKFVKADNRNRHGGDALDNIGQLIGAESKAETGHEKVKDINIRMDKKGRLYQNCPSKSLDALCYDDWSNINNIKRIKIDGDEKNLKIQLLRKFNINKTAVREDSKDMEEMDKEDDEENIEDEDDELMDSEVTSQTTPVHESSPCPEDSYTASDIETADRAWEKHMSENDSVIVKTFHGQFKNTVICSECSHVSVTYEPFMYLSVPIPHAMERQLCVIFIPKQTQPVRYLLNLHKNDNILKAKSELRAVTVKEDCDIVMVEVIDYHISRILDDNVLLRFVNDSARSIYAFEMVPPPVLSNDFSTIDNTLSAGDTSRTIDSSFASSKHTNNLDIFSGVDTFSIDPVIDSEDSASLFTHSTAMENANPSFSQQDSMTDKENSPQDILNTDLWEWTSQISDPSVPIPCGFGENWGSEEISKTTTARQPSLSSSVAEHWRSCAICLEELLDSELMVHATCGGTFCSSCLEMSLKHHGDVAYTCPVCLAFSNPTVDYVPLADPGSKTMRTRILAVPVAFRCSTKTDGGVSKQRLCGHPNILYLPNSLPGDVLYCCLDTVLFLRTNYTVVLTDEQAVRCSRCPAAKQCSGCEVSRDSAVTLQPGDHITVVIIEGITVVDQIENAQRYTDHQSMSKWRPDSPTTIYDCFTAFMESETLDEHNPWYCPSCCKNQRAKKTMTVWRYPDNLIIYLKRFVFHDLSSTKIDNLVSFSLENLNLSEFISGPRTKDLVYNLHSTVCHFGGVNSGHYTCYTNHPVSGQWFYYNDDAVCHQMPRQDHYSSAYVLFYIRQQESNIELKIPELPLPPFEESAMPPSLDTSTPTEAPLLQSMALVLYQPLQLPPVPPQTSCTSQPEPDSTFDFYS